MEGDIETSESIGLMIFGLSFIVYFVLDVISTIKRLHDLNKKGSYFFMLFIPLYNIILGFALLLERGTDGHNNYGQDPRCDESRDVKKQLINYLVIITLLACSIWKFNEMR